MMKSSHHYLLSLACSLIILTATTVTSSPTALKVKFQHDLTYNIVRGTPTGGKVKADGGNSGNLI